jgi:mannose-1-phosphate guanylyltransferase
MRYREKSTAGTQWISAGIYALEPEILDAWPADRAVSLEREILPGALANGGSMFGHLSSGFFVDIGTPQGYEAFRDYIEAGGNGHSQ